MNLQSQKSKSSKVPHEILLAKTFTLFSNDIKPSLSVFFELLDDSLFNLSEKAESNKKQSLFFESMRMIRKSQDELSTNLYNSIQNCFKKFKRKNFEYFNQDNSYNPKIKSLALSLVDDSELDESLAKINLINKSEMAYHENIYALKKRFAILLTTDNLTASELPVGPFVIVNAFNESIKVLKIDITIKIIMYKLFERSVLSQLNQTYININNFLAKNEIITEIKYNLGSNKTTSKATHTLNTNHPQQTINTKPSDSQQAAVDENYNAISQIFKQNNQAIHQSSAAMTNIDMGSILNALSILQGDLLKNTGVSETGNQSPTEIKDKLINQLHSIDTATKDKSVQKNDRDIIDLVGMLFQFIVDDRNLPATIQVLLAKLQIPYLKIALQDKNLFADKNHPARALLDKLSLASVGWNEDTDKNNQFLTMLEDIINNILEMDDYQEESFGKITEDFDRFIARLNKKSNILQKRANEKSLGQEKIQQAKTETAKLLVDKMTNQQMPILIRDILLGEWSNVLVLMFLRHNSESQEYVEKINFVDKLIEFSGINKDLTVTKEDIGKLVDSYQQGIKFVAFNPQELATKAHELTECLYSVQQIDSNASEANTVEHITAEKVLDIPEIRKQSHEITDYIEEVIEPTEIKENFDNIDKIHIAKVEKLETGNWLEFSRKDAEPIRAKLSWISPITGKYLLVNSSGIKITDKSKFALAAGLQDKSIIVLQQIAIFDRALSSIAKKLKNSDNKIKENQ